MLATGFYSSNLLAILSIQFILFIMIFTFSFRHIRKHFRMPGRTSVISMAIIILILAGTSHFTNEKMRTMPVAREFSLGGYQSYYPTDTYNTNKDHATENRTGGFEIDYLITNTVYPWGPVYPFMLSILFFLSGPSPLMVFVLDALMITLLIPTLFFLLYIITKDERTSLFTTLFSAATMISINSWLGGGQFFEIYFFFFTLSLLLIIVSYKANRADTYSLAFLSILMTMEIFFESIIMLPAFFIGILVFRKEDLKKRKSLFGLLYKMRFVLILLLLFSSIYFVKVASVKFYLYDVGSVTNPPDSMFEDIFGMLNSFNYQNNEFHGEYMLRFSRQFLLFWVWGFMLPLSFLAILSLSNLKRYRREISLLIIIFVMHTFTYVHIWNGYQTVYAIRTLVPIFLLSGLGISTIIRFLKKYPGAPHLLPAFLLVFVTISLITIPLQHRTLGILEYSSGEKDDHLAGLAVLSDDRNIGTIVAANPPAEYTAEFLTLHDAVMIEPLVSEMFYFPETERFYFYTENPDFSKSLWEIMSEKKEQKLEYMLDYIENSSSYLDELSEILVQDGKNNYYVRHSSNNYHLEEMELEFIRKNFRMEMLSNTSNVVIYSLSKQA